MMMLRPLHQPGMGQFVYFYQHSHPDLGSGFYVADWCAGRNLAGTSVKRQK